MKWKTIYVSYVKPTHPILSAMWRTITKAMKSMYAMIASLWRRTTSSSCAWVAEQPISEPKRLSSKPSKEGKTTHALKGSKKPTKPVKRTKSYKDSQSALNVTLSSSVGKAETPKKRRTSSKSDKDALTLKRS